jgi:hypothetical protein
MALGMGNKIITDCYTRVLGEELVVTSVPYHCSILEKCVWLDRGLTVRRQRGLDWLVRPVLPQGVAVTNLKPQTCSWNTGRTILFPGTGISIPTCQVRTGLNGLAACSCSCQDSFCARRSQTISFWILTRSKRVGRRPVESGFLKWDSTTICLLAAMGQKTVGTN